jgi:hypothetical protein
MPLHEQNQAQKGIRMPQDKDKDKKKKREDQEPVAAGWCENFAAHPGQPVDFTPPAGATISQSGNYWPFCGPNGTALGPPINFGALNEQIYIKTNAPAGSYEFIPAPCGGPEEIHTVTVS